MPPLIIVIRPKQDQLALYNVLGLEPELGRPTAVRAQRTLGDDALQPHGAGFGEQGST